MISVGLGRASAGCGGWQCAKGIGQKHHIHGRRDKSACPKRCKPLTRLAFWRACRSVAGMKPGFSQLFQGSGMHGPGNSLPRATS
jgi:hypothetical protein